MIKRGYSSTVWVDEHRKRVSRFGCGRKRKSILQNYNFLEKFSTLAPIPLPLGKRGLVGCVVTHESLLVGEEIDLKQFDFDKGVLGAMRAMEKVYASSLKRQSVEWEEQQRGYDKLITDAPVAAQQVFEVIKKQLAGGLVQKKGEVTKCWIHGDVTYRNMLLKEGRSMLFDCDRSELAYPEFDLWTLYFDWRTHLEGPVRYAKFLQLILQALTKDRAARNITNQLYMALPELAGNRGFGEEILGVFLLRSLAYAIRACMDKKASLEWLDEIQSTVRA